MDTVKLWMLLLPALMFAGLIVLSVRCFWQNRRISRLAAAMEDFLVNRGAPLEFSVREDRFSALHNACAETENSLLLSRERLAEENRRTENLVADISHQLKTPLASLRLFCEMDESRHMNEQLQQIERMEKLISALLRLERLCADGYSFTFSDCDVGQIITDAWAGLQPQFPKCRLSLSGSARIRCDEKWLGEAFGNLFKNACEHMRSGGQITVRMEQTESAFFCTVEDTGGGVKNEALPRLFDRFYREENSGGPGTGIGLAIAKEIIVRHHGAIDAENGAKSLKMNISIPLYPLTRAQ